MAGFLSPHRPPSEWYRVVPPAQVRCDSLNSWLPAPSSRLPAPGSRLRRRVGAGFCIQSIIVESPPGRAAGPTPRTKQSTFSIKARDFFLAPPPDFMSIASLMAIFDARAAPNSGCRHEAPRPPHTA